MSRNKTKNKIKKQDEKKDKIEKNRGDRPTGIGDESNRVGQMPSHTETKRGVLTDGYNRGEILVSEAAKVPTKEERGRRAKGLAAMEI